MYVFDIEVYCSDWLIVFKRISTGEYTVIHNDNHATKQFVTKDKLLAGFNCKFYDQYILKAILCGADNTLVKEINDFIIAGNLGFEHWFLQQNRAWFNSFDIRDDMQQGLSLKTIEGHLGLNIEESSIPFDINRPLTEEELKRTIHYCKYDVDVTERLVKLRKPYLEAKLELGRMVNIPEDKALYSTNAKIVAQFLGASRKEWDDERDYKYPKNLKKDLIPNEVFKFFNKMQDENISDKDLFKSKIEIDIQGIPCVIGFGGIHHGIPTYSEEEKENRIIRNFDIASYYPSLMINNNYISRNIPSAEVFKKVYYDRMKAKKEGDKRTSDTLKLVLNTSYGTMLNKYNGMFDPLMGRSVCISGQLYLTELAISYIRNCKTLKIIQLNTDGVMFSIDKNEMEKVYEINAEWEKRTGFILEEDEIRKVVQKDVNNYIVIMSNGRVKTKGGYVSYGISPAGAFNINNDYTIVKKAIIDYFVKDIPVEETINNCKDILEFQYIAKASSKYSRAYHIINDSEVEIQKVNRVYASKDPRYGTLFRVHKETGRPHKISGLPDSCIIDNRNELTIDDIDKEHYVQKAKEMIADFKGKEVGDMGDQYVKLSDLRKVPGIGKKTMERIRAECEIFTLDEEYRKSEEKNEELSTWLDELLESEN